MLQLILFQLLHDIAQLLQRTTVPSHRITLMDFPTHEKYKGTGKDGKLFNLMNNSEKNLYLKTIAKACGVDKRLSYHCGRHSYATSFCLTQGVPIETLSQMMSTLT